MSQDIQLNLRGNIYLYLRGAQRISAQLPPLSKTLSIGTVRNLCCNLCPATCGWGVGLGLGRERQGWDEETGTGAEKERERDEGKSIFKC